LRLQEGLPPLASESRVLICAAGSGNLALYPVAPQGLALLRLGAASVELERVVTHPQRWDYMGTTGWFVDENRVLMATLTTQGVRAFAVDL